MEKKINIIVTDDEVLFRQGIVFLLNKEKKYNILFEASNGKELLDYIQNSSLIPEIILIDLKMPELNGVETTKKLHEKYPQIKIIALSSYNSKSFILNMIQVGASAFLSKNNTPKELLKAIEEVYKNDFYYTPEVLKAIQQNINDGNKKTTSSFDENYISKREKEVLELICKQLSATEIGEKLYISPRTVDGHRNNLLLKTESKNTAGLVVYAIQNQLIDLENLADF
jgi:DNA-binding NarL/FixJ family response regulator